MIQAHSLYDLESAINSNLEQGWELYGDLTIYFKEPGGYEDLPEFFYFREMVKYAEPMKEKPEIKCPHFWESNGLDPHGKIVQKCKLCATVSISYCEHEYEMIESTSQTQYAKCRKCGYFPY